MSNFFRRLPAFAGPVVICLLAVLWPGTVLAAPLTAGGSVIISASIAPARYILVDSHGRIREVLSNSPENVMPLVYKGRFNSAPITLTPAILSQYKTIMAHVDARHDGVIYQSAPVTATKPAAIAGWLRLKNYARAAGL